MARESQAKNTDSYLQMYRQMVRIRSFEDNANQLYLSGKMPGLTHMYSGQEAVAVGICEALEKTDHITSTHRGHCHCIAKCAEVSRMFAEFFGKESGYCRGRGGSMHIADLSTGNLGANGIVGGGLPIAVGAAFSAKQLGTGAVAVCFFGDGANNEGAFHEALNMAAVWKLPVVFFCENNRYGMSVSTERSTAVKSIADCAVAYAMPGVSIDGNDLSAITEAMEAAVTRARAGDGPTLIESLTYRWRGHSKSDRNRYRSKEEIADWMTRDPIRRFAEQLVEHGVLTPDEVTALKADAAREIAQGIVFAQEAPSPDPAMGTRDVYTPAPAMGAVA